MLLLNLLILLTLVLQILRIPISKCVVRLCNSYPLASPVLTCSRPYFVVHLRGWLPNTTTLLLSGSTLSLNNIH